MSKRAVITLKSPIRSQSPERLKARAWVNNCPPGTRIEFRAPRRSVDQNSRLWAILTEIAKQKPEGRDFDPEVWKCLFMSAWRQDVKVYPSLDGKSLVPVFRSSELTTKEMIELQDFIEAWCAENNVLLSEDSIGKQFQHGEA